MNVLLKNQPAPLSPATAVRMPSMSQGQLSRLAGQTLFAEEFPEILALGSHEERKEFIECKIGELYREVRGNGAKRRVAQQRLTELNRMIDAYDETIEWAKGGVALERPAAPRFRELRAAISRGENLWYAPHEAQGKEAAVEIEKEIFRYAETFIVEHDWATAFAGTEMKGAPFKLPYDVCAFEFRFSGRTVIALATNLEADIYYCPAMSTSDGGWLLPDFSIRIDGPETKAPGMQDIFGRVAEQIRAVCIALDAEVAASSVVREPYTGERGKNAFSPARSYHVVSLSRRAARTLPSSAEPSGRKKRLHFRRGHWRHFEDHKTWIKWMLVGDPDIGFVEKHYRL